jgi:hypothetical protein
MSSRWERIHGTWLKPLSGCTLLDVVDGEEGEGKLEFFTAEKKREYETTHNMKKGKSQLEQNGKDNEWEVERMLTLDVLPLVSAT